MKKWMMIVVFVLMGNLLIISSAQAQDPILLVIKQGVIKVIKAMDLKIQRLQNETIWLQNAQKVLENKMAELHLTQIADWTEKNRKLYADYFDELRQIKSLISYYHEVKDIIQQQKDLVVEYKNAFALFKQDNHFTTDELEYMFRVYTGIVDESLKNLDQLFLVVKPLSLQMSDEQRLFIIHEVARNLEGNARDLNRFNQENIRISLQRSKDQDEIDLVKKMYGL